MIQAMGKLQTFMVRMSNQFDNKDRGTFPAQPQANPRGQPPNGPSSSNYGNQEQAKAVTILRSGKIVGKDISPSSCEEETRNNIENPTNEGEVEKDNSNDKSKLDP